MSRSTKKEWTDDKWPLPDKKPHRGSRYPVGWKGPLIVMLFIAFLFTGCGIIQINPSTDANNYEMLGRDIGTYMKIKKPEVVEDAADWVEAALLLTDEEILSNNALQAMYEYLLKEMPENAEIILLAKSTLNILGVKINLDASQLLPEDRPKYVECVRGLLKGYSEATK